MPIQASLANAWLNTLRNVAVSYAQIYVSLHTADPGNTGANEVTGGSYARQLVTFNAPANSSMSNSADLVFSDMPEVTVTHVGLWTAASGGTFLWGGPLTTSRTLQAGDALVIAAGNLTLSIS